MQKIKSLILFNLICLSFGCGFALLYDYFQKNKLADFVIASQRNNIIVKDIAAFAGEISALSEVFYQIKIIEPLNEVSVFKVDQSIHPMFVIKIKKQIFNNNSLNGKISDIDFYYCLNQPFSESFVLGILICLILSPFFLLIQKRNLRQRELENQSKINSKYAELARQVAHDIRSPLTALQVITNKIQQSNSEEYQLVNEVFNRITNIADNLLDSTRHKDISIPKENKSKTTFEVNKVVNSIIKEKNLSLKDGISIIVDSDAQNEVLCCGEKAKFQGLFSNLVQNAIESKNNDSLTINIFLRDYKSYIEISIIDNGCGIPAEITQNLATKGFTYNKIKGNGLGLYHAKKYLVEWGGELKIFSQLNSGTQVSLKLLRA